MRAITVLVLSCSLALCGCATAPSLQPVPAGDPMSIAVVANPKYPLDIDVRNTALGDAMSTGAGAGALAGGLWGLTCGPFAVLCVPLGAATGMLTGVAAGAAVGAAGALPGDKATQVKDRLLRLEQAHPVVADLQRNLAARAQKYWTVSPDSSAALITAELQPLKVATTRDERLQFILRVTVTQRQANATPLQKTYEYASPLAAMPIWLDEGSDFLDTSLTSACQQISAQIVADLAVK